MALRHHIWERIFQHTSNQVRIEVRVAVQDPVRPLPAQITGAIRAIHRG